jgi:purine-nucleoside phosphorylase
MLLARSAKRKLALSDREVWTSRASSRTMAPMSEQATLQLPRLKRAADDVRRADPRTPAIALVLGSGLGGFADSLDAKRVIPFAEITGMPQSNVVGHAGNLVIGEVRGTPVVAMQGRVHLYEGHPVADVVFGTRLMRLLGAHSLLITNAAGGCGPGLVAGDLMLIEDHLNLTGQNCLVGPNEPELGVRFPDMSEAYDRGLRQLADEVAGAQGLKLARGVYAGLLGPSYETPAEVRMLARLGADAVGMSTVLEVVAARHMGMRVLGISCITNLAAGISESPLSHDEVTETATRVRRSFEGLLRGLLERLGEGGAA